MHFGVILFREYEENIFSSEGLHDRIIPHQAFSCLLLRMPQTGGFTLKRENLCMWPAKIENLPFSFFPKGNMF